MASLAGRCSQESHGLVRCKKRRRYRSISRSEPHVSHPTLPKKSVRSVTSVQSVFELLVLPRPMPSTCIRQSSSSSAAPKIRRSVTSVLICVLAFGVALPQALNLPSPIQFIQRSLGISPVLADLHE